MNNQPMSISGIAILFWIIGATAIAVSALTYFAANASGRSADLSGTMTAILSGILVIGFGSAIYHLSRIEQHLAAQRNKPE